MLWYAPWFSSSRSLYLECLEAHNYTYKLVTSDSHFDYSRNLSQDALILKNPERKLERFRYLWDLTKEIYLFRPNIIFVDDLGSIPRLLLFSILSKKYATVAVIDDVVSHDQAHKLKAKVAWFRNVFIRSSSGILVFSENSKQHAQKLYPQKIVQAVQLIPEIKIPSSDRKLTSRENFAMIGRWSDYKGFDIGIDIFKTFKRLSESEAKLDLWCSNAPDIEVGCDDVIWRSKLKFTWDDLVQALPRYRAVLLPYRSATQSGVQVLSWSLGVPCLISDEDGLIENQPPNLLINNLHELTDWVNELELLESDEYLNEISNLGLNFASEKYSLSRLSIQMNRLLKIFLTSRRGLN